MRSTFKIAVTGVYGNIGSYLVHKGAIPIKGDIRRRYEISEEILRHRPDVVIHCAALTDTNYCESHIEEAIETNVRGTYNVLECLEPGQLFVYLSTSYVFSGQHRFDYTERHDPSPINIYGYTKWGGELVTKARGVDYLIVRISKAFNRRWMQRIERPLSEGLPVKLSAFSVRSFIYIGHFVDGLLYLIERCSKDDGVRNQIFHLSGSSSASYYSFWKSAAAILGYDPELILPENNDVNMVSFPRNAGLNSAKAHRFGVKQYNYVDGLREAKNEEINVENVSWR